MEDVPVRVRSTRTKEVVTIVAETIEKGIAGDVLKDEAVVGVFIGVKRHVL